MKNFNTYLIVICFINLLIQNAFSNPLAQKSPAQICTGELKKSEIQSILECTNADLNKFKSEIEKLETELKLTQKQLETLLSSSGSHGFSHNQIQYITSGFALTAALSGLGVVTFGEKILKFNSAKKYQKIIGTTSIITFAISLAGVTSSKNEQIRLEFEFADIPYLKELVNVIQNNIRIRKAVIEYGIKLKSKQ